MYRYMYIQLYEPYMYLKPHVPKLYFFTYILVLSPDPPSSHSRPSFPPWRRFWERDECLTCPTSPNVCIFNILFIYLHQHNSHSISHYNVLFPD